MNGSLSARPKKKRSSGFHKKHSNGSSVKLFTQPGSKFQSTATEQQNERGAIKTSRPKCSTHQGKNEERFSKDLNSCLNTAEEISRKRGVFSQHHPPLSLLRPDPRPMLSFWVRGRTISQVWKALDACLQM